MLAPVAAKANACGLSRLQQTASVPAHLCQPVLFVYATCCASPLLKTCNYLCMVVCVCFCLHKSLSCKDAAPSLLELLSCLLPQSAAVNLHARTLNLNPIPPDLIPQAQLDSSTKQWMYWKRCSQILAYQCKGGKAKISMHLHKMVAC